MQSVLETSLLLEEEMFIFKKDALWWLMSNSGYTLQGNSQVLSLQPVGSHSFSFRPGKNSVTVGSTDFVPKVAR